MKKLFVLAAVAVSMLAASCGGTAESECEAYLKTIDSTTEAMQNCKSAEEMQVIATAFEAKANAFAANAGDKTASEELLKKIEEAGKKYQDVAMAKAAEFMQAAQAAAPAEEAAPAAEAAPAE